MSSPIGLLQSHNADSILEEDEEACSDGPQDSLLLAKGSGGGAKVVLARKKRRPWVKLARRLFIPHRFKNLQVCSIKILFNL
jgi:hypothetical protein